MISPSAAPLPAGPLTPPSTPAARREPPPQRRRRVQFQWRLRQLVRSIPKTVTGRNVARYYAVAVLVASLSKRQRRNVVLPWQPRPLDPQQHPEARVVRGRRNAQAARP